MKLKKPPKVLIIGIDGGTFDLIHPWVKENKLPNFASLMKNGTWGDLTSTIPPVTAPAWTSFMTGQNPGNHGLFHFIEPKPNAYEFRYTNAISRNSKTVWRILSENNLSVGVINVPMTYPPETINGYMISGMDTPDEDSNFTHPIHLKDELKNVFGSIKLGVQFLGDIRTDKRRTEYLNEVMDIEKRLTDITLYLLEKYPTDVSMVVYRSTDQVPHLFWHYMDKSHPNYDAEGAKLYRTAIFDVYKQLDNNIGRLMNSVSENTSIILMSDHGSGPTGEIVVYLNKFLEKIGLLKFKHSNNSSATKFTNTLKTHVDNFLRFYFSSNLKARLIKRFPEIFNKWQAHSTAFSTIDWANTKAFCYEVLTFPPDIWINKKGQWPNGIVTDEEYQTVISVLKEKLYSLKHPKTGLPLIKNIYEKKDVSNGHHITSAPDLIIDWWQKDSIVYTPTSTLNGEDFLYDLTGKKIVTGTEWSGTHRLNGMVLFKGPQFKTGNTKDFIHITDLAPTILYLLKVPPIKEMDGRVPKSVFNSYYIKENPINYEEGELCTVNKNSNSETYTEDETAKIEEKLRNLGYMN